MPPVLPALTKPSNRFVFFAIYKDLSSSGVDRKRNCKLTQKETSPAEVADNERKSTESLPLPPEPQDCCMSGCANCVWVKYAEELAKLLNNGGEMAKANMIKHVKDPNLRAFLMLELDDVFKRKKK